MGLLESFAKGFLIYTCIIWIFVILEFFIIGQEFLAVLMIIALVIPSSMVIYEYLKARKNPKRKVNLAFQ